MLVTTAWSSTLPAATRSARTASFSSRASALVATVTASAPSRWAARAASAAMAPTASSRRWCTTTASRSKRRLGGPGGVGPLPQHVTDLRPALVGDG